MISQVPLMSPIHPKRVMITLQSDDVATPATRPLLTVDFSTGAPSGDLKLSVTTDGSSLTFMWNSTTGMEYALRSSTDLLGDPAAWPVYDGNDGIAADPPKNTLPNVPFGGSERFFVVTEAVAP